MGIGFETFGQTENRKLLLTVHRRLWYMEHFIQDALSVHNKL